MDELVCEVLQESDGGYSAECLTENIFTEGQRGTTCARTWWRRPLRSFLTGPGLGELGFTLSATKSSWWHEDSSRRLRCAARRRLVPKIAVREGAPGRQPHHSGNLSTNNY